MEDILLLILVAQQLLNLSATYKTPTSISLKWNLTIRPLYVYNYVVYYESGGGSHSVSFRGELKKDNSHMLTDLPAGGIHNISLVALVHLPSPLAGPVSPGMSIHNTSIPSLNPISAAVDAPVVILSGEGSGVTGTSYTLTCKVSLPNEVQATSPNIQWKTPNMLLFSSSSITNTSRGFLATLQLQSLQSTDEGEYICLAGYYLGNISSPLVMRSATLHVIGKSMLNKLH